jgi:O-antigen ligase
LISFFSLLRLDYAWPTRRATEIKDLVFRFGALGVGIMAACAWLYQSRSNGEADRQVFSTASRRSWRWAERAMWAWIFLALYGLASGAWSRAGAWSSWHAMRDAYPLVWTIGIALLVPLRSVRWVAWSIEVAAIATAAVGLIYHYWFLPAAGVPLHSRLSYPMGNPLLLAACLLPGTAIAATRLLTPPWRVGRTIGTILSLTLLFWAIVLTQSRSGMLGLAVGVVTVAVCVLGRSNRQILLTTLAVAALGVAVFVMVTPSAQWTRASTIQMRLHTWQASAGIFADHWLLGGGAGGFASLAPSYLSDVMALHPTVFTEDLVVHAHNEILETAVQFGLIGLIAWGFSWLALALAVRARLWGVHETPPRGTIVGLAAAVSAVWVEELASVALHAPGAGAPFYTAVGGLLAACRPIPLTSKSYEQPAMPRPRSSWSRSMVRMGTAIGFLFLFGLGGRGAWKDWRGGIDELRAWSRIDQGQLDEGVRLAEAVPGSKLAMADRIEAEFQLIRAYDALAGEYWDTANLAAEIVEANPLRPSVLEGAKNRRKEFLETARKAAIHGLDRAAVLGERVPQFLDIHWLQGLLHWTLAGVADQQERRQSRDEHIQATMSELYKQLGADPFHARTLEFLLTDPHLRPRKSLETIHLFCRWIRSRGGQPLDADWRELLVDVIQERPSFISQVSNRHKQAQEDFDFDRPESWNDDVVPERFFLAGQIALLQGDPEEAKKFYEWGLLFLSAVADRFPASLDARRLEFEEIKSMLINNDQARLRLDLLLDDFGDAGQAWRLGIRRHATGRRIGGAIEPDGADSHGLRAGNVSMKAVAHHNRLLRGDVESVQRGLEDRGIGLSDSNLA